MKFLKLCFFSAVVLFAVACDNDGETCISSDWVGTYTGTADCDGTVSNTAVTITESSSLITIEYVVSDSTGSITTTYPATAIDGCAYSLTQSDNGLTMTVAASIDGDNLSINEVITNGTDTFTCDVTATRD